MSNLTLNLETPYGLCKIFNFNKDKLTAVIPTGVDTSNIVYDNQQIQVNGSASDVIEAVEYSHEKPFIESLVDAIPENFLGGMGQYYFENSWREETRRYMYDITWMAKTKVLKSSVQLDYTLKVEIVYNCSFNSGYNRSGYKTFEIEIPTLTIKTFKQIGNLDVRKYIEDCIADYWIPRYKCGFTTSMYCVPLEVDAGQGERGQDINFYCFNLYEHRANKFAIKDFELFSSKRYELIIADLNNRTKLLCQEMQDKARVKSASMIAAAIKSAGAQNAKAMVKAAYITKGR